MHALKTNFSKTKKIKTSHTKEEKARLWEAFDNDSTKPETQFEAHETDICSLCNHVLEISENGLPACTNTECGVIYTTVFDYGPEWRPNPEDKNGHDLTRCGNPINPLLVESSFGCKAICGNSATYEMRKIRKWIEWQSMPHREKSLYSEFQFISTMAHNSGIPKIFIDNAMAIHKDISEQKMFRGLNRDGIKAASIYISCRINGCPRTAHEIAEMFKLDKTSATTGCSMAVNILNNIERNCEPSQQSELGSTKPIAFIDRYCSKLNVNNELTKLSKFVACKIDSQSILSDNAPNSIAAGIIYFICQLCNQNVCKSDIKKVCNVSEVTINKCFKKLDSIKDKIIPSVILDKYS